MVSQRIAKSSLILNAVLILACFGLLIYVLLKQTEAERMAEEAFMQRQMAIEQKDMAERFRQIADSAMMEAMLQRDLALAIRDSVKLKNQTNP